MPALVAIEVTAPEPVHAPWLASLLEACNASLTAGACEYAAPGSAERTAQVTWNTPTQVTITFHNPRQPGSIVRTLEFTEADEPGERWRTVGFTTALLAGGQPAVAPETPPAEPAEVPYSVAITARLVGASGVSQGGPKAGGQVRLEGRAWQTAWLFGVSAEYTTAQWESPDIDGRATWGEVGAGVAVVWQLADDLELFTRVDVLAQRLNVSGQKKKGEQDAASLWQPGARLTLDLDWPLHPRWYAVFGAHVVVVTAPAELRVDDKSRGYVPSVSAGLNAGIQYRF